MSLIPTEIIERNILFIRGVKVILDTDLAELYDVEIMATHKDLARKMDALEKK